MDLRLYDYHSDAASHCIVFPAQMETGTSSACFNRMYASEPALRAAV